MKDYRKLFKGYDWTNYTVRPMPEHQYASCNILIGNGYILLRSYSTIVAGIVSTSEGKIVFCTGTYSRTTISHIGWFAKYLNALQDTYTLSYYTFKDMYNGNYAFNIETGEIYEFDTFDSFHS